MSEERSGEDVAVEAASVAETGPGETGGDNSSAPSGDRAVRCPECSELTIPKSDKCQHCGTPIESGEGISLEVWEWGGALVAAFGFFLTPVFTAPIALFCAYKIYDFKQRAAWGILTVVLATILFWIVVPLVLIP